MTLQSNTYPIATGQAQRAALFPAPARNALVLTDELGAITRVACPSPWGAFTARDSLKGEHISTVFMDHEYEFVSTMLRKMQESELFSLSGVKVYLADGEHNRSYLAVSSLPGASVEGQVFVWQFSLTPRALTSESPDREYRLLRRLRCLESRLEAQHKAAERRRGLLSAAYKTIQVDSRVDLGTVVTVILPIDSDEDAARPESLYGTPQHS